MHLGYLYWLFVELTAFWAVLARALQRVHNAGPAQRFKHTLLLVTRSVTLASNLSLGLDGRLARAMAILFCTRTFSLSCIFCFLGALKGCRVLLEGCFRSFLEKSVDTLV